MVRDISGVGVALVTPFNNDKEVDYDALGRIIEYVIEKGVDYLVALGTTGETPTLTEAEKKSIIAFVKKQNAGRLPIVVGCGGYNTADVINCIDATDLKGVSAVLSVTPYYNKPSQEGLYQHYKAIAAQSPVPVILYNVPSRTGVNMTAETTLRLAREVDNILGIKEACGTVTQMARILVGRPAGFRVFSGDDILALPLEAMGGDGVISVAANVFPDIMCAMAKMSRNGENTQASGLFMRLYPALELIFSEGNPTGVKSAMAIKELLSENLRLPLVEASAELRAKMKKIIVENNL